MKKVISIGVIFLLLAANLTGCTQKTAVSDKPVSLTQASKKERNIALYVKQETQLGKYEPLKGIYLGAYVDKNRDINGDIAAFEELVDQPQTFNVFQYTMGKGLSAQDVLKCMANKKVPYIKLLLDKDYDLTPLYRMISDIRDTYSIPVFIELFPLTSNITQPMTYKEIYQKAFTMIDKYLNNAVVVWSADDSRLYDMPLYYPGDDYADWVGLNLYIPQYRNSEKYVFNDLNGIDFWYKSFQKSKPLMISSLAISHFSRVDHTYYLQDAENKLDTFYTELPSYYPRIKGIVYIDVDMGEVTKSGKEDYRITSQKQLTEHMKQIFRREEFLDEIEELQDQKAADLFVKYDMKIAQFGEELYLPKNYMTTLFKKVPLSKIAMLEDLNGDKFYKLSDIEQFVDLYYKDKGQ